mmetsp:Transcript_47639/g.153193  ORF Transcript_47639/g.153193 Transcript_47639/m.153193 type:complete len:284 (+) Transcript_47639:4733-5584(+)
MHRGLGVRPDPRDRLRGKVRATRTLLQHLRWHHDDDAVLGHFEAGNLGDVSPNGILGGLQGPGLAAEQHVRPQIAWSLLRHQPKICVGAVPDVLPGSAYGACVAPLDLYSLHDAAAPKGIRDVPKQEGDGSRVVLQAPAVRLLGVDRVQQRPVLGPPGKYSVGHHQALYVLLMHLGLLFAECATASTLCSVLAQVLALEGRHIPHPAALPQHVQEGAPHLGRLGIGRHAEEGAKGSLLVQPSAPGGRPNFWFSHHQTLDPSGLVPTFLRRRPGLPSPPTLGGG